MASVKKLTSTERYSLKKILDKLKNYSGRGTQLISLYIPASKALSDVTSYLKNELSESSNIKSKSTRKNVTAAISSILSRLKMYKTIPENGLVFFIGHHDIGADQTNMTQNVVEPPLPITTFRYRCDSQFELAQLVDMVRSEDLYGLIVIDRSEATIGLIRGRRIEMVTTFASRIPSKHSKGGQSAQRFERLIEIAAHEFFKKAGESVNNAFLQFKELEGIIIGGPGHTKDFFMEKEYIHHELKKKIIGTFTTSYTNEFGLKELANNASDALKDIDLFKEKQVMVLFLSELRKVQSGLAVYGQKQVQKALLIGALNTLILSEELRKDVVRGTCVEKNKKKVFIADSTTETPQCPDCGGALEVYERIDLVESFSTQARTVSTEVKLISSNSEEGDMLIKAFGGIAGILRYRLDL